MGADTLKEMPHWAHELLAQSRVARLGLLDDHDRPRVLPVTYAIRDGAIWSAIDRKPKRTPEPARLRYLRRRPEVALTVDRYSDDWNTLAWVQILGRVDVIPASEASGALDALADKYEPYRLAPPPGPVLRLEPERAIFWSAAAM
jgi:PPOX class probable F420-dependent enzyme